MEKLKDVIIYLSIPYIVLVSGIYHYAYWSNLEINIFQYLDLQELIKGAIYPFISTVGVMFFLMLVNLISSSSTKSEENENNEGMFAASPNGIRIERIVLLLIFGASLYITILLFSEYTTNFFIGTVISGLLFTFILASFNIGKEVVQNKYLRFTILNSVVLSCILAFSIGFRKSQEIKDNIKYKFTIIKFNSKGQADTVKLLGHAGNFYFFTSLDNNIKYQVKTDELSILKIEDFDQDKIKKNKDQAIK